MLSKDFVDNFLFSQEFESLQAVFSTPVGCRVDGIRNWLLKGKFYYYIFKRYLERELLRYSSTHEMVYGRVYTSLALLKP